VLLILLAWLAILPAAAQEPLTTLPTAKGLPVVVNIAVAYVDLAGFDENEGTFEATVDVRLRWEDPRLKLPPEDAASPPKVFRGADADVRLAEIWSPPVELMNQKDDATYLSRGLRIFPSGEVELITRTTATFTTPFVVERFPFDRQRLQVDAGIRTLTSDALVLVFRQDDIDFSRAAEAAGVAGWSTGRVELNAEPLAGWYSAGHARVVSSLEIRRDPSNVIAAIFIPLFASLLIPFLAIWLNRMEDGVYQVDSFELVNLIIGGLFAVIALNFTVNSEYQVLGTGDNPVNRLFALNYLTLGVSLLVNILLYRFRVAETLIGRYAQEQLYFYLMWAIPVLALTMATAIILVAMA
jgi:hypothetical protein